MAIEQRRRWNTAGGSTDVERVGEHRHFAGTVPVACRGTSCRRPRWGGGRGDVRRVGSDG